MRIYRKFLSKTAIATGVIAGSLITLPISTAHALDRDEKRAKSPFSQAVQKSMNRTRAVQANRGGGNRNAVRNRGNNNRNAVRNRGGGNRNAARNRGGGGNRNVVRYGGGNNTTIIRNITNNNPTRLVSNNRGYRNGNRNRGYRNGYRDGSYDRGYRNRGYNRGYRNGYRDSRYRNNGAAFATGLFGGALLYSAFNNHNYYNNHASVSYSYSSGYPSHYYGSSYYYGPRYYRPRTRVVYVQQPVQTVVQPVYAAQPAYSNQPVYTNQQQGAAPAYQYQPQQAQDASCLQVREYTTTIEIGGQTVPAYGQACLQPDGAWKFGDPIAEPSF